MARMKRPISMLSGVCPPKCRVDQFSVSGAGLCLTVIGRAPFYLPSHDDEPLSLADLIGFEIAIRVEYF